MLFEDINEIEVEVPVDWNMNISEEEMRESEFLDTLNAQY